MCPCRLVSCLFTSGCSSLQHAKGVRMPLAHLTLKRGGANNRLERLVHLTVHFMLKVSR